jgi:hypothetical protein
MGDTISVEILDEGFVLQKTSGGKTYRTIASSRQEVVKVFAGWLQGMALSGGSAVETGPLGAEPAP